MIRIKFKGETMLVRSLEGYEGATVLADNVTPPPSEFHEPKEGGGWQVNAAKRDKAKKRERFVNMGRDELIDHILDQVEPLRRDVESLKARP